MLQIYFVFIDIFNIFSDKKTCLTLIKIKKLLKIDSARYRDKQFMFQSISGKGIGLTMLEQ